MRHKKSANDMPITQDELSLTGIEPVWFEMENSLPNCVKKA